jgi:hypothetical protein
MIEIIVPWSDVTVGNKELHESYMPQHNNSDSLTDARKRNETSKNRFFE